MQHLTPAEQSYVREGSSNAVQKERLLARILQRTVLARYCAVSQLRCVACAAVLGSCALQQLTEQCLCKPAAVLVLPHPTLQVLHRYCSEDFEPPSLRFERNAHGKPQLSWEEADAQPDPPIHFSLTHTSSLLGKITALPASYSVHLLIAYHMMHVVGLLILKTACKLTTGCTFLHKHSQTLYFTWTQLQCPC